MSVVRFEQGLEHREQPGDRDAGEESRGQTGDHLA